MLLHHLANLLHLAVENPYLLLKPKRNVLTRLAPLGLEQSALGLVTLLGGKGLLAEGSLDLDFDEPVVLQDCKEVLLVG